MINLRDYFLYKNNYIVSADPKNSQSYFVESLDLNNDGNKDVIFFGFTAPFGGVTVPIPQGSFFYWGVESRGYSLASTESMELPATTHPREIAYADFNNDGKLDIFLADHGWDASPFPGGQNQLIISNESGWGLKTLNLPNRTDFTHCTTVGDINNDGNIDIFLGNVDTSGSHFAASILFGDGLGNFTESTLAVPSEIRDSIRFYAAQLTDLNNDGWIDLVIGNSGDKNNSKSQSIVYWNQQGFFDNTNSTQLSNGYFGAANEQILDIQSGDINGDGQKDLVLLSTQNNPYYDGWSLQILINRGGEFLDMTSQAFGSGQSNAGIPNEPRQAPWIAFLKLIDINNDDTLDIVFDSIKIYGFDAPKTQPLIYLNDGFSKFTPIFADNLLDLDSSYIEFFADASFFANENEISWINSFYYENSIYFRELFQIQPLPKISITGSENNDKLSGNALNNVFDGQFGDDSLDGGDGVDTAAYFSKTLNYQLTLDSNQVLVQDLTGGDGIDTLSNIELLQFADRLVHIESSSPTYDYTDLPDELYQFFIVAFGATPGVTYMDQLAEAYQWFEPQMGKDAAIQTIVDIFTTKSQYLDLYPDISTLQDRTNLVEDIVKSSASAAAKAAAVQDIGDALAAGWSVGKVIYTVFGNLANQPQTDATWGGTAKQFANELAVANYYTEVLHQSTDDVDTLRDVLKLVGADSDVSSDAAIVELIGVGLLQA